MKKLIFLVLLMFIPFHVNAVTEAMVDINDLSIDELQEYVDKGYLNYETITKLYLDRIDAYNSMYNAIITINDKALDDAKAKDIEYHESGRKSKIFGLPILVKDNIDVEGLPTTNGTKALLDSYPNKNADVIQKLIDAGAVILGKTNMDEFAFNAKYSHSSFGYVKNAFNTNYSSYGSSGGSAVAVASNLCVYALGTDTGVSSRVPSAANGVVGMRPSRTLLSGNGVIKFDDTRDVVGVITKYASDSAIVLDILDDKDIKYEDYEHNLKGVKIGAIKGYYNPNSNANSLSYGKTSSFIYDMMNNSIKILENLGAEIVYIDNFYLTYKFDATTMCYDFNEYIKNTSSKIKSLDDLIRNGGYTQYINSYNGYYCNHDYRKTSDYQSYLNIKNNNKITANKKMDQYGVDAIIYPTLKTPILTLNEAIKASNIYTPSYAIAPLVDFPALTIPMGINNGFSYGLEIVSRENKEDIIYKIAMNYETINKVYKTPSIAPALYTVSKNINTLVENYNAYKENNDYTIINTKTKEFLDNYSNDEEKINNLIEEYANPYEDIALKKEKIRKRNINIAIIIISSLSLITLIILIVYLIRRKLSN